LVPRGGRDGRPREGLGPPCISAHQASRVTSSNTYTAWSRDKARSSFVAGGLLFGLLGPSRVGQRGDAAGWCSSEEYQRACMRRGPMLLAAPASSPVTARPVSNRNAKARKCINPFTGGPCDKCTRMTPLHPHRPERNTAGRIRAGRQSFLRPCSPHPRRHQSPRGETQSSAPRRAPPPPHRRANPPPRAGPRRHQRPAPGPRSRRPWTRTP